VYDFDPSWMDSLRTPRDRWAGDQYVAGVSEWMSQADPKAAGIWHELAMMAIELWHDIAQGKYNSDAWLQRAMDLPKPTWGSIVIDLAALLHLRGLSAGEARQLQRQMGNRCLSEALYAAHPSHTVLVTTEVLLVPDLPDVCPACVLAALTTYAWVLAMTGVDPDRFRALAYRAAALATEPRNG
jgi:hypothetical protein